MGNDQAAGSRKMTFMDRAVALISPGWALERKMDRERLTEFAATHRGGRARGRLATAWSQGGSETWKKNRERIDAIWEAREMEEKFSLISGLLQKLAMYICGTLEYQPQTGNAARDQQYAEYFHSWCERCDLGGRHRLKTFAQLGVASAIRDGEHGWAEHVRDGELRLQAIEGDRIGNPQDAKTGDEKNLAGIKIDDDGRVTAYEIHRRTKTNNYVLEQEVTPANFIHLFFPNRTDQYHGVSKLAPVLPHARDLYELFGHEKIAAKFAASFAGFVKMKDVRAPGAADWDETKTSDGVTTGILKAAAGTIVRMEAGAEEIVFPPGTQRPSGAFIALVEAIIREIALGMNLSYGFLYNMAVFGGVTARLETQAIQRVIRYYQEKLEETLLNRVKEKVLMLAIASRKLPYCKDWNKGSWRYGAAITGDVGHQTGADLELVRAGAKAISGIAIEHGGDFAQIVAQKATEIETIKAEAEKRGIPMELLQAELGSMNPTVLFANLERAKLGLPGPDAPPPPPPGMIGSVGDKGVKVLLDLLEKVGSGLIDRESGIMALMKGFGLTYAQAEKMVPVKAVPVLPEVSPPPSRPSKPMVRRPALR